MAKKKISTIPGIILVLSFLILSLSVIRFFSEDIDDFLIFKDYTKEKDSPYITGMIHDIKDSSILVAKKAKEEYRGDVSVFGGNAGWFDITEKTEIRGVEGEEISFDSLRVFKKVEIWVEGHVLESYPVQAQVELINVIKESEKEVTKDWSTYKNKEIGFEFRVAPFFEEIGCVIAKTPTRAYFKNKEQKCFAIAFETMPINPPGMYVNPDRIFEMFVLHICPAKYCKEENMKDFCQAIREKNNNEEFFFKSYVTENEDYFIYIQNEPSKEDSWYAKGWDDSDIKEKVYYMQSSLRLVGDLSPEEKDKWIKEGSDTKCKQKSDLLMHRKEEN